MSKSPSKPKNNKTSKEAIKAYVRFRDTVREDFMEKYKGLNINGVDYRQYVFNYFEDIFSLRIKWPIMKSPSKEKRVPDWADILKRAENGLRMSYVPGHDCPAGSTKLHRFVDEKCIKCGLTPQTPLWTEKYYLG